MNKDVMSGSVSKNFRVTINLSNFFYDHRTRARIFIDDNIHTISDLEQRIKHIFNIKNFYLTSENEYLPPTENVKILQKDDIIWVIQKTYDKTNMVVTTPVVDGNNVKKKRSISVMEDLTEQDFPPKKKKKKKFDIKKNKEENIEHINSSNEESEEKRKYNEDCITKNHIDTSMDIEEVTPKNKKMRKKLDNRDSTSKSKKKSDILETTSSQSKTGMNINSVLSVLQSHISSYNEKIKKKCETGATLETSTTSATSEQNDSQVKIDDKNELNKCKGTLSFYKKKVPIPTITEKYLQNKKINIVKIEYLSGPVTQKKDSLAIENTEMNNSSVNKKESNHLNNQNPKTTDDNVLPLFENKISSISGVNDYQNIINYKGQNSVIDEHSTKVPQMEEENFTNLPYRSENVATDSKEDLSSNFDDVTDMDREKEVPDGNKIQDTILFFEVEEEPKGPKTDKSYNTSTNDSSASIMKINKTFDYSSCKSKNTTISPDSNYADNAKILNEQQGTVIDSKENENFEEEKIVNENQNMNIKSNFCKLDRSNILYKTDERSISNTALNLSANYNNGNPSVKDFIYTQYKQVPLLRNNEWDVNQSLPNIYKKEGANINLKKSASVRSSLTKIDGQNVMHFKDNPKNESYLMSDTISDPENVPEVNNLTSKDDLLNKNISSFRKNDSNNLTVTEESNNLCDNGKDCEMDLATDLTKDTADALDELSSIHISSIESRSTFSGRKHLSGIGLLLGELRSNESLVTGESLDSDISDFVTKRRRKRVRKRKKKDQREDNNIPLNDSSTTSVYTPRLRTKACPTVHLKFEEEDGGLLKTVDVTKKDSHSEKENESYAESSYVENISIDSDLEESEVKICNINEEYILKSPSIENLLPKVEDKIAFKILRITENYTPEISSFIIGKVIEFNADSKVVLFEILNGIKQCEEPEGRLAMETVGDNHKSKSNKREFLWSDVIDPRLLFP